MLILLVRENAKKNEIVLEDTVHFFKLEEIRNIFSVY